MYGRMKNADTKIMITSIRATKTLAIGAKGSTIWRMGGWEMNRTVHYVQHNYN